MFDTEFYKKSRTRLHPDLFISKNTVVEIGLIRRNNLIVMPCSHSLINFIYIGMVEIFVSNVYLLQTAALVGGSLVQGLSPAAWFLVRWMSQASCQRILHEGEHSSVDDVVTCDRWQPYHVIPTLHEMLDYVHCLYHLLPVMFIFACSTPSLAVNFRRASLQFAATEFASHEADLQCSDVTHDCVCKKSVFKHWLIYYVVSVVHTTKLSVPAV
jgi:hypothetical protein